MPRSGSLIRDCGNKTRDRTRPALVDHQCRFQLDLFQCAPLRQGGGASSQDPGNGFTFLSRPLLSWAKHCNSRDKLQGPSPEYQTAFDLNHDLYSLAMLGQAYARNGQKEEARKILARLSEEAKSQYVAPYALALVQIAVRRERASDRRAGAGLRERRDQLLFCHQDRSNARRPARQSAV